MHALFVHSASTGEVTLAIDHFSFSPQAGQRASCFGDATSEDPRSEANASARLLGVASPPSMGDEFLLGEIERIEES
ncbi:hypothetical protein, partial [Burkholderia cenocepacia]|uniref:hypothetical protein n=1 Tax=Burkholderia cenocepacia TaxID=95486 RepID=UPI00195537A0